MANFTHGPHSVCLKFDVEDGEELREIVKKVSQIEAPSTIPNKVTNLGGEDAYESTIAFSTQEQGNPLDADTDYLILNQFQDNDGEGHIHINTTGSYTDQFLHLLDSIVDLVEGVTLSSFMTEFNIEKEFSDLNFKMDFELPESIDLELYQVTGLRFDIGDPNSDYLFQMDPESSTTVLRWSTVDKSIDVDGIENLIQNLLEEPVEIVEAL